MKILISEKLSQQGIDLVQQETSWQIDVKTGLTPKQLLQGLTGGQGRWLLLVS